MSETTKYSIRVKFIDDNNMFQSSIFVSPETRAFLESNPIFEYDKQTSIRDFILWVLKETGKIKKNERVNEDDSVAGLLKAVVRGEIDGSCYDLNMHFPFHKYAELNAIHNELVFHYITGIGAGWFGNITSSIKVFINSDERRHANTPHVHVQKGKYNRQDPYSNTVRVKLDKQLTVLDNKNVNHIFKSDEWDYCINFIEQHRDLFIKNYNLIVRGVKPVEVLLDTQNGEVLFR